MEMLDSFSSTHLIDSWVKASKDQEIFSHVEKTVVRQKHNKWPTLEVWKHGNYYKDSLRMHRSKCTSYPSYVFNKIVFIFGELKFETHY